MVLKEKDYLDSNFLLTNHALPLILDTFLKRRNPHQDSRILRGPTSRNDKRRQSSRRNRSFKQKRFCCDTLTVLTPFYYVACSSLSPNCFIRFFNITIVSAALDAHWLFCRLVSSKTIFNLKLLGILIIRIIHRMPVFNQEIAIRIATKHISSGEKNIADT